MHYFIPQHKLDKAMSILAHAGITFKVIPLFSADPVDESILDDTVIFIDNTQHNATTKLCFKQLYAE